MIDHLTSEQGARAETARAERAWDDHGMLPVQEIPSRDDATTPGLGHARLVDEEPAVVTTRALVWRETLLAVAITLSVTVLPAVIVALVLPGANPFLAAACAVAISLALANLESLAWRAWPGSRDLPYKDLTIWGLAHRRWSERRLRSAKRMYEAAAREGSTIRIEPLEELSRLLSASNPYTFNHVRRVAAHAEEVARALHLPPAEVARIRTAAVVHDIGKLHTPAWILDKPGALTGAELAVIKRHPVEGARMLEGVGDPELAAIVRHHHERFDGGGYPEGLSGQQIPLGSRIIAVADSFDAITSTRPYRRARSQRAALQVLAEESETQFDPEVVQAFIERYSPKRSLAPMAVVAAICQRGWEALPLTLAGGAGAGAAIPALGAASVMAVSPAMHGVSHAQVLAAQGQPMVVMEHNPVHRHRPGLIRGAHPSSAPGETILIGNRSGGHHGAGKQGGSGNGKPGGGRGLHGGRGSSGGHHGTLRGGGRRVNAITTPKTGGHAIPVSDPVTGGSRHHHHHGGSGSGNAKRTNPPSESLGKGTAKRRAEGPTTGNPTSTPPTSPAPTTAPTTTNSPTKTSPPPTAPATTTPTTPSAPTTTTPSATTTPIPPATQPVTPTPTNHQTTPEEAAAVTQKREAEAKKAAEEALEATKRKAEEATKKGLQEALERTAGALREGSQGEGSQGSRGQGGDEP